MAGDPREILLCFMTDAFQPFLPGQDITREALLILEKYEMKVTILTKGGQRAVRDFDILARNKWSFGTTIVFDLEESRMQWEPLAAPLYDRIATIKIAKHRGIKTWVSMEPLLPKTNVMGLISSLISREVDDIWIGKNNYDPEIMYAYEWKQLCKTLLKHQPLFYPKLHIKSELLKAGGFLNDSERRT